MQAAHFLPENPEDFGRAAPKKRSGSDAEIQRKKPLTVFVTVLAILVLGVVAYLKMTPDLMPNMDFPYVVIVTTSPGASPETVEADITKPMEQSMATLNEIKHVTSSSKNSVSMVVLEFEQGVNMDSTGVDIQQKIATLQGGWDDTVGTPYVLKINPTMLPVAVAAVSSDKMDVAELSEFVDSTLSAKLEGITGVASVSVSGVLQRQMNVILSQEKLDALSEKLATAVSARLDASRDQLQQTRQQLLDAKEAIRTAEETAISQTAEKALLAARDSLREMDIQEQSLRERLTLLQELLQRKTELEAKRPATMPALPPLRITPPDARAEGGEDRRHQGRERIYPHHLRAGGDRPAPEGPGYGLGPSAG
ncbi:MAG: efflux RND transporter permease subunit [Oscillospiraceae bacterium]